MQVLSKKEKITYWVGVHLGAVAFFLICCVAAGVSL